MNAQPGVVTDRHACKRATVQWEEAKVGSKAPASAPAAKRNVSGKKKREKESELAIFPPTADSGRKPLREYIPVKGRTPYYVENYMFIFLPAGLLYTLYRAWMKGDPFLLYWTLGMEICVFIFIAFMFRFARRYFVYSVGIFEDGLTIYRFLDYSFIRWADILSFHPSEGIFTKQVGVLKTSTTTMHLPMLMKDKARKFPTIKAGLTQGKWVQEDGTSRDVTFENSPLYSEIVPHLQPGAVMMNR